MADKTLLYWVSLEDLQALNHTVIDAIDHLGTLKTPERDLLTRIHTELAVSPTRNETSIFPTTIMLGLLNIPEDSIAVRLTKEEVKLLKSLDISEDLKTRLT